MRRWRSFLAITMSAPSSIFLRPTFQASATRIEYCSIVSGCVVGTISTAIWLPLRRCRSRNVCVSTAISPLESVAVWSTTSAVNGGTATSPWAAPNQHSVSARMKALAADVADKLMVPLLGRRGRRIEIDLGRGRDFLFIVDREIRLFLVAERHRGEVGGERADGHVIVLHCFDVAVARHCDAVFGALELRHQIVKQRVRFELRIVFRHH